MMKHFGTDLVPAEGFADVGGVKAARGSGGHVAVVEGHRCRVDDAIAPRLTKGVHLLQS